MITKEKILRELLNDKSNTGLQNYAIVSLLFDTGMKSIDICEARFEDIKITEKEIKIVFGLKRNRKIISYISKQTYEAIMEYWRNVYDCYPNKSDYLFYTIIPYKGSYQPMKKSTLWVRLKTAIGISTRDIERLRKGAPLIKNDPKIDGFLYFLSNGKNKKGSYIVIGETQNIEKRLEDYCRHSGPTIDPIIIQRVDNRKKEEKEWHEYFKNKRVHDAWFLLDEKDIELISKYYGVTA